jgi:hypothetical protein
VHALPPSHQKDHVIVSVSTRSKAEQNRLLKRSVIRDSRLKQTAKLCKPEASGCVAWCGQFTTAFGKIQMRASLAGVVLVAASLTGAHASAPPTPAPRTVAWWLADYSSDDVAENTLFAKTVATQGLIGGGAYHCCAGPRIDPNGTYVPHPTRIIVPCFHSGKSFALPCLAELHSMHPPCLQHTAALPGLVQHHCTHPTLG